MASSTPWQRKEYAMSRSKRRRSKRSGVTLTKLAGGSRMLPLMASGPVVASELLGCAKVAYDTERAARAVASRFRQDVYRCRMCRKWHATSAIAP